MEDYNVNFLIGNLYLVASFFIADFIIKGILLAIGLFSFLMGSISFKRYMKILDLKHKSKMLEIKTNAGMVDLIIRRLDRLIEIV